MKAQLKTRINNGENVSSPRYNVSQEANYKAEANKKDNLLAVARLIPPGKSQELRPLRLQFKLLRSKEIPSNSNVFRVKAFC